MEFTYEKLENLFYDINEIIDYIEGTKNSEKRFRLFLSNGDKINYNIPNNSIAHLLGIDTNYLMSTGLFSSKTSFDLLKEMCNNAFKLNKCRIQGQIDYKQLFSKYILSKVESFKENIKVNIFQTEFICKYNSEITYCTSEKNEKYDYIIVRKYQDGKIGLLGIVRKGNYYVPMSNQIFENYETAEDSLNDLIRNQEITLISGINITNADVCNDYNKTYNLYTDSKLEKLRNMKFYKNQFNTIIDVSQDSEYFMQMANENYSNMNEDKDLIDKIVDSIKNGQLIDIEIFRNTNLIKIIESFNDFICNNSMSADSSVSVTYSTLIKDLNFLKEKVSELETVNNTLQGKNQVLENRNTELNFENDELKEKQEKIYEILKPRTN